MKRTVSLLIMAAVILVAAGCKNSEPPPPSEPVVIPTEAVQPNSMKVSELIGVVNTFLEFEEGYELTVESAEVMDDPANNERIYVFNYGDFEVVLFADLGSDTFGYGYMRTMTIEYNTLIEVASVAGAFLKALEPSEGENMLTEIVMRIEEFDSYEMEDFPEDVYTSYGEVWGMELREARLFNIFPKD